MSSTTGDNKLDVKSKILNFEYNGTTNYSTNSNLYGSNLQGANFSALIFNNQVYFRHLHNSSFNLINADLTNAKFKTGSLTFNKTNLCKSKWNDTKFVLQFLLIVMKQVYIAIAMVSLIF